MTRANGSFVPPIPPSSLLVFNEIGSFVPKKNRHSGQHTKSECPIVSASICHLPFDLCHLKFLWAFFVRLPARWAPREQRLSESVMGDHIFATLLFSYTFRFCFGRPAAQLALPDPASQDDCRHHDVHPRPASHKSPISNLQSIAASIATTLASARPGASPPFAY